MSKCCRIRLTSILFIVGSFFISIVAMADPVMMQYEDYMTHCMNTYGDDRVTESVCDAQYSAIEKKEQALTAQAESLSIEDEAREE